MEAASAAFDRIDRPSQPQKSALKLSTSALCIMQKDTTSAVISLLRYDAFTLIFVSPHSPLISTRATKQREQHTSKSLIIHSQNEEMQEMQEEEQATLAIAIARRVREEQALETERKHALLRRCGVAEDELSRVRLVACVCVVVR